MSDNYIGGVLNNTWDEKDHDTIMPLIEQNLARYGYKNPVMVNIYTGDVYNQCTIKNKTTNQLPHDDMSENVIKFVECIEENEPEWYKPGKFIPKAFITEKFNEMYGMELSTRKFLALLKKHDLYNLIAGSEKLDYYFTKNFGEKGKRYRGFIAKKLQKFEHTCSEKANIEVNPVEPSKSTESTESTKPEVDTHKHNGKIYLIQEREFVNSGEPTYKLGKTKQLGVKRFDGYSKGSEVMFMDISYDVDKDETELIKIFKEQFKWRSDYGHEYFTGDIDDMRTAIINYLHIADK